MIRFILLLSLFAGAFMPFSYCHEISSDPVREACALARRVIADFSRESRDGEEKTKANERSLVGIRLGDFLVFLMATKLEEFQTIYVSNSGSATADTVTIQFALLVDEGEAQCYIFLTHREGVITDVDGISGMNYR